MVVVSVKRKEQTEVEERGKLGGRKNFKIRRKVYRRLYQVESGFVNILERTLLTSGSKLPVL